MKVALIYRHKDPLFFSLEKVFDITSREMEKFITVQKLVVPEVGVKLGNLFYLRREAKRAGKDCIFHITGDIHYAVFALPRGRTMLTIHDCNFMENYSGVKKWILKKILLDWPIKYVKVVSAISEKTRQEIIAFTKCNPGKLVVVNNPNSPEIYYSEKVFNERCPVLLFVGSTANKNLDRSIDAIKGLTCILHIIGQPSSSQISKLNENGIDYVLEKGLSEADLAKRYSEADIIFFPSLYEGFGLPIIEGFKAGRPVLTSNLSPMKDIASDAAWLVDPYSVSSIRESIMQIITDKNQREVKFKKGLKLAENFEPSQIAKEYINIYKSILV